MAYCIQCGSALPSNAKFCPNCGEKAIMDLNAFDQTTKFENDKSEETQSVNNLLAQESINKIDYSDPDNFVLCKDNVRYKGELKNGNRDGFGIYFTNFLGSDYSKEYEGEWENNFFKGNGKQYHYPGYILREGYFNQRENYFKGKYNGPVFDEDKSEIIGILRYEGEMSVDTDLRNSLASESYEAYDVYIKNEDFNGAYNYFSGSMVPNGYGKSYYNDGTVEYEGYWKFGSPHGQGIHNFIDGKDGGMVSSMYWIDSSILEGEFIDSSLVQGKITHENGDIHIGEFEDEVLSGSGKIIFNSGIVHEGNFEDGELNGPVKISFLNGLIYEGSLIDGKMSGNGRFLTLEGVYEGEFENDSPNGTFVFTNNDNVKSSGYFKKEEDNSFSFISSNLHEDTIESEIIDKRNDSPIPFKDGAGIR